MPSVRVGEVDVAYGLEGAGEPVVLVHGTTSSRDSFQMITPVLAANHLVVLPEFPGSGQTVDHAPDTVLQVDDLAHQAIAAADDAGLDRFHVGGWSLGAVVATAVAALVPDRVKSLTAVCGWVTTDSRMRFTFGLWDRLIVTDPELFARYAFADGLTASAFDLFGDGVEALVPVTAATLAPGSRRQIELDTRVDISALLPRITAPALVIGGIEDRWVPIEHSRQLAAALAGSRLVELPCGHLVPTEQAPALLELLSAHVAAHS